MTIQNATKTIAGAAALLLSTSTFAMAQGTRVAECEQLYVLAEEADGQIRDIFANVNNVIRKNDATECTYYMGRVERAGGLMLVATDAETEEMQAAASDETTTSEGFSTSETLTRTVEIEQRAIVEGEVVARIPDPEVAVDVPGAQVMVEEQPAEVSVQQAPMTVVVRQPAAQIAVMMPKPVITIEQPAPEIFIEMEDPDIALNRPQPKIRVVMPEPTITVSQGEPELDVEVQARLVDGNEVLADNATPLRTRAERIGLDGQVRTGEMTAQGTATVGDATVEMADAEVAPRYNYTRTQPTVRFEGTDPQVTLEMEDQPEIRFSQVGEPVIRFTGSEEQRQAAAELETEEASTERTSLVSAAERRRMNADETRAMMLETDEDREMRARAETDRVSVRAIDIAGIDVYTRNDEYVGDIDRIVQADGQTYIIVEHGGFLGIGDTEVALPVDRIAIRGEDRAILLGMTEEQFDAMPDVDVEFEGRARPMVDDAAVEVGRIME